MNFFIDFFKSSTEHNLMQIKHFEEHKCRNSLLITTKI